MRNLMGSLSANMVFAGRAALALTLVASSVTACIGEPSTDMDDGNIAEAEANLSGAGGAPGTTTTGVVSTGSGPSTTGSGGFGGGGGSGGAGPVGLWLFDDCAGASNALLDSSGQGATATRSATTACAPGIDGLGVAFDNKKDTITIPDSASLTFTTSMTVAAWIHPSSVAGTQAIVNKQTSGQLSFSLGIKAGTVQFSIARAGKSTIVSSAPVSANAWTHVAGVYDGTFVFLFVNGQQVGQIFAGGTIKDANAPIRIGNDAKQQPFAGTIDRVLLSANPLSAGEVAGLACISRPATFTAAPLTSGPVAPGTAFTYNIAVTNKDVGACQPDGYFLFGTADPPGLTSSANPQFFSNVAPGQTVTFPFTVTSSDDAEPGLNQVPFGVFNFNKGDVISGAVGYEVTAPTGCFVRTSRELMIKNVSVVDDPIRTQPGDPALDPRAGAWTFGRLMENMAPTAAAAPDMVEQLFTTWLADRTVNGFTVPARTFMQQQVLDTWPRTANGKLDLGKSPLRLLTIVNRIDLRNLAAGNAGEGRFVFGVLDANGFPLQFTVILEYHLPATTQANVLDWASSWHALGSHPFPSEEYNVALQALTARFAGQRRSGPGQRERPLAAPHQRDRDLEPLGAARVHALGGHWLPEGGHDQADSGSGLRRDARAREFHQRQRERDHRRAAHGASHVPGCSVPRRRGLQQPHRVEGARDQQQRGAAPLLAQHLQRVPQLRGDGHRLPPDQPAIPGLRGPALGVPHRHHGLRSGDVRAPHLQRSRASEERSHPARLRSSSGGAGEWQGQRREREPGSVHQQGHQPRPLSGCGGRSGGARSLAAPSPRHRG